MTTNKLVVYGHNYCPQALVLMRVLKQYRVDYEWRNVMTGPQEWQTELLALARGNMSVPTVVFPDGQVMVEPQPDEVLSTLKIEPLSLLDRLRRWQRSRRG